MERKPRIFRAIMTALLGLIIFGIAYFLVFIISGGIIYVLALIPIINWLFQARGDSPDMVITVLATVSAYYTTKAAVGAISKAMPTRRLSIMIVGGCLAVVHVISLAINLVGGEWILPNIVQAVAGVALFFYGKNEPSE